MTNIQINSQSYGSRSGLFVSDPSHFEPSHSHPGHFRRGLSLIEIMIALTMTLIVLGAMMTAFQYASEQMQSGRAMMELANRTRVAESLLRSDFENMTVEPRPYAQTTSPNGFFEYIEGQFTDSFQGVLTSFKGPLTDSAATGNDSYLGDVDDVIGMTVRNSARPFRGRGVAPGSIIESSVAEVWWYTTRNDLDVLGTINFEDTVKVHRRVLLVRPDLTGTLFTNTGPLSSRPALVAAVNNFISNTDISVRVVITNPTATSVTHTVLANSLSDLTLRKNRFCHDHDFVSASSQYLPSAFPHMFDDVTSHNDHLGVVLSRLSVDRASSNGLDVLLTDANGFDIRVYSPDATVKTDTNIIVGTSDVGYAASAATPVGLGSYVDLGQGFGQFTGAPQTNPPGNAAATAYDYMDFDMVAAGAANARVFDTWTPFYESDGIDQDGDGTVDQGTNGVDSPPGGGNGVDDSGERETLPPYPHPIRGIEVRFRSIEKNTKQVNQTTIVHSFVPE